MKRVKMLSFFFQAEDGIRDYKVTGVQTCALPIFLIVVRNIVPVKITLFHAQSINSPIAPCVNFGLTIPPKYHNTLGRQKNINLLPVLYRL